MLNQLKKINNYSKIFFMGFLVLDVLPIHTMTGSNIQSIIADGFIHYFLRYNDIVYSISRILMVILFVSAYYTNDTMLLGLLIFFNFWKTSYNKDEKDKGHWYV
tara:strand:+ start:229 stop:540 length:312 start_codon:yes stop_codon:yes gene_type:complete